MSNPNDSIDTIDRHQLAVIRDTWQKALDQFTLLPCDASTQATWSEWQNHCQLALRAIEEDRTEITKPINASLRAVNSQFKTTTAPLEAFKALCGEKIGAYQLELDNQARAARQDAALAAQNADQVAYDVAISQLSAPAEKPAQTRVSFSWVPETVDLQTLDRTYVMADMTKLTGLGKLNKDSDNPPVVAGVTWKRVASAAPTGRSTK